MNRLLVIASGVLLILFGLVALRKSGPALESTSAAATQSTADKEAVQRFWAHYRQATDDRMAGRYEAAAAKYEEALALNGRHEDGLYYLGNMYLELGNFKEAEAIWQRLLEVNPNSARTHSRLGALYLCNEDPARFSPEAARQSFLRAHEINKEETGPTLRLGEAALLQENWPAAATYFDAVTGSNFSSVEGHFYGGFAYWKRGDLQSARERFQQAVSYSRRSLGQDGIVGEGDTGKPATPVSEENLHCPLFEIPIQNLTAYPETVDSDRIIERYRQVEAYLQQLK